MKATRNFLVIVLLITSVLISLAGCSEKTTETETTPQTTTVQRGNLSNIITAAGNLALAKTEDLAVDLFFQQGTIAEVLVEVGDSVTAGQVLARLDTEEWQEQIDALETSLNTTQRNLTTKERALSSANRQLVNANQQVILKELAFRQAELDVSSAESNLSQIDKINQVQTTIEDAEYTYKLATSLLTGDFLGTLTLNDFSYWNMLKTLAKNQLEEAQEELALLLSGTGIDSKTLSINIATKQLQLEQKKLALGSAELDMEYALDDLANAQIDMEYATVDVDTARKQLLSISNTLEDALEKSPEIIAPFDGFIVAVNVKGGDEVSKGKVAVQIADPNRFQADIFVNEVDILQVSIGTTATVAADAITGTSFSASVTHISPTATITSGVVNYLVRVELTSSDELAPGFGPFGDTDKTGRFPIPEGFEPPEGFEFPTEFEAPEGFEIPEGFQPPSGNLEGMIGFTSGTLDDLRDGMSVTVSLIISSEENVLLVPYTAVTVTAGKSYVQVVLDNGETEQREVTTGSTNYTNIIIVKGLEEGETIVVPEGTITGDFSQFQFGGGMMFPGMGGGGR